jgi:hypothetical protein
MAPAGLTAMFLREWRTALNSELIERVKKGNSAIMEEYCKAAADENRWPYYAKRIDNAADRLHELAYPLLMEGFDKCLYTFEEKPECDKPSICVICFNKQKRM